MVRVPHWVLIVAIVGLSGCSPDSDDLPAIQAQPTGTETAGTKPAGHVYQDDSWRARYLALGRDTYKQVCASCHDESEDGAPPVPMRAKMVHLSSAIVNPGATVRHCGPRYCLSMPKMVSWISRQGWTAGPDGAGGGSCR